MLIDEIIKKGNPKYTYASEYPIMSFIYCDINDNEIVRIVKHEQLHSIKYNIYVGGTLLDPQYNNYAEGAFNILKNNYQKYFDSDHILILLDYLKGL
jgi:hypothetical protein